MKRTAFSMGVVMAMALSGCGEKDASSARTDVPVPKVAAAPKVAVTSNGIRYASDGAKPNPLVLASRPAFANESDRMQGRQMDALVAKHGREEMSKAFLIRACRRSKSHPADPHLAVADEMKDILSSREAMFAEYQRCIQKR